MPTLRQLRSFTVVAEAESLTKAATLLGVGASTLSAQISALERELACKLLHRDGRGVHLSEEGFELLRRSQRILRATCDLKVEMANFDRGVEGSVRLGMLPTICASLVSVLYSTLKQRFPKVRLELRESLSRDLFNSLRSGELDLATLYDIQVNSAYRIDNLFSEELFFVSQKKSEDNHCHEIAFPELIRHPLILPTTRNALRTMLEGAAAAAGLQMNVFAEIDSLQATVELVARGYGDTILPRCGLVGTHPGIHIRGRLITGPSLKRTVILAWSPCASNTPATAAIASVLRELLAVHVLSRAVQEVLSLAT
jgi:LysR family transcriptional regulator, nitrogen assimilation regulatory protein